jgi:hypothetical protein
MQKMPAPGFRPEEEAMNRRTAGYALGLALGLALGICFITLALFSQSLVITGAEHDCHGEGCPVCLQIQGAENFSRQFRQLLFQSLPPVGAMVITAFILSFVVFNPIPISAVALKVRMNT